MFAQLDQKQDNDQQHFLIEQQINLFSTALPQILLGQSDIFFKQICRDEGVSVASVNLGFQIAKITPEMYDLVCMLINQIHCQLSENLKLIFYGNQLWATSTIIYPILLLSQSNYNIVQANNRQSLMKTVDIIREILKECRVRYDNNQPDQEILKAVKSKFRLITKAFVNPNADY